LRQKLLARVLEKSRRVCNYPNVILWAIELLPNIGESIDAYYFPRAPLFFYLARSTRETIFSPFFAQLPPLELALK
jgi:hypothetical protein